jgi:O-antigen ligase
VAILALAIVAGDSTLGSRFTELDLDPSALARLQSQANAIDQFLASPWIGSAYIELELRMYPHNPIVESAMATGVIGLVLFTLLFGNTLLLALRRLRRGRTMVALLCVQYLVASVFSSSIYASPTLWLVMALMISIESRPVAKRTSRRIQQHVRAVAA